MAYAGGLKELFMTSIFYLIGTGFYIKARKQYAPDKPVFTKPEKIGLLFLAIASVVSMTLIIYMIKIQ